MSKLPVVLALSLAVLGCNKKDGDAVAGGGDNTCVTVIDGAVARMTPELQKSMGQLPQDKIERLLTVMKATFTSRCVADKWPSDHLKCLAEGKTNAEMKACEKSLPEVMRKQLADDMKAALAPIMGDMANGRAIGKPAEGSAGSGS